MGFHPVSLAVRFLLELASLLGFGYWGWKVAPGGLRWAAAVILPALVAVLWGVFATPGDPSRSGNTVVATPGLLRLILELAVFFGAALAVHRAGAPTASMVFLAVLVLYHLTAFDRILWLIRH